MKYLVLMLALLIAVPLPQSALACEMQQEQEMPASPVDPDASGQEHDCCPPEPAEADKESGSCDGSDHCGACLAGASAVPPAPGSVSNRRIQAVLADIKRPLIPVIDRSFYRPPIA